MEDENNQNVSDEGRVPEPMPPYEEMRKAVEEKKKEEQPIKIKKWDHLAIRPNTFLEFKNLKGKNYKSDDAFVKALIQLYKRENNIEDGI